MLFFQPGRERHMLRAFSFFGVLTALSITILRAEPGTFIVQTNTETVDEKTLTLLQGHKLQRYSLFERKLNGGAQISAAWYQENAEPAYTCLLQERIGPPGEGGKWVCNPDKLRRSKRCIVYSVGSRNDFRFEEAILRNVSSACEVHVFDHTVTNPTNIPQGMEFHPWGLAAQSDPSNSMFTLHDMLEKLDHVGKKIDIFKIDCDGCEWTTYPDWLDSKNGVLIDEILVEVHSGTSEPKDNPIARQFMQKLYDHNFLIFHKEPNVQYFRKGELCVEYGFKHVTSTGIRAAKAGRRALAAFPRAA